MMIKKGLLVVAACSLLLFGCASGPDSVLPEDAAEEPPVIDLDQRPLVFDSDEELNALVDEFSLVVEDAAGLLEDLRDGGFEAEVDRIEELRGRLELWRDIAEDATIDPESTEISPEEYERFIADLGSLRNRLWDVVLQINREIAQATGIGPDAPGAEG